MNGTLPKLRDDLVVRRKVTGAEVAFEVALPGGASRSFTARVYECVRALSTARDIGSWSAEVQRRHPEVTVTQLERLLTTLIDLGFAVVVEPSREERPVVTKAALHQVPLEEPPWNPDSTAPGGPDEPDVTSQEGGRRGRRLNADITQVTVLPVLPKPKAYADISMARGGAPHVVVLHRRATRAAAEVTDRVAYILSRLVGEKTVQELIDEDGIAFDELKAAVRELAGHGFIEDDAGLVPDAASTGSAPGTRASATASRGSTSAPPRPHVDEGPAPPSEDDALSLAAENTVARMLSAAGQLLPDARAPQRFDGSGPIRAAPGQPRPPESPFESTSAPHVAPHVASHVAAPVVDDAPLASQTESVVRAPLVPAEGTEASASNDDDEPGGAADAPEARRRRLVRRLRAIAVPTVVVALVIVGSTQVRHPLRITSECEIRPLDRAGVRAPLDGILAEVLVDEGQRVEKGAVLARLGNADLRVAVVKSQSALERARAELKLLLEGSREEEIARARTRVAGLAREVDLAQGRVSRTRKLVKDGVAPRDDLDRAEGELASLQGQLSQARAEWKLLQAGTRPEEQRRKEAEIRSLEAQLELDQRGLEATEMKSPMSGVLVTKKPRELVNSRVAAGDVVFEILEPLEMRADVFVPERDFDVLQVGLPLKVKVTAYPTTTFEGKVTRIAQEVERRDIENVIRVEGVMQNNEGLLLPNMTGFAEVEAEERTLLELAMRRVVRWFRVRFLI